MENLREEIQSRIDRFSRAIISSRRDNLGYCYSIGNHSKGFPEFIVVGSEQMNLALNLTSNQMLDNQKPFIHEELVSLGGKCPIKILEVFDPETKKLYTPDLVFFYGHSNYRLQQILIPDENCLFPGDKGCAHPHSKIPLLGSLRRKMH